MPTLYGYRKIEVKGADAVSACEHFMGLSPRRKDEGINDVRAVGSIYWVNGDSTQFLVNALEQIVCEGVVYNRSTDLLHSLKIDSLTYDY